MRSLLLVICGALVVAGCTSSAGASVSAPLELVVGAAPLEPAPTSTTLRPAAARSPLVVTGPVRYDDADGAFHGGMTWQQQVRHDEFNLFFDVAVQFTISPDPYSWDGLDYLVTGSVLVDAASVSCISTFFDHECGIVDLTDAELSGTARLSDDRLVVTTDWRRFGLAETPARASMRIGRWADDGSAADAVGVAVIHDVAESLEDAGYVTRTIELPLSPHRPFRLTGTSTWGSGRGVLELVANP